MNKTPAPRRESSDGKAPGAVASAAKADKGQRPATEKRQGNEEPEPTLEDDLPSDGRDEQGEAMIRDLPDHVGKPSPASHRTPKES